jgi:hypothetical protein
MMRPAILLLLHVFFAAGTCLPSRCLAPNGGIHLTEPFPCNDRRDTITDTQTDWGGGVMKYAVEMGLGAMMYVPSFIKIDSVIQKLIGWGFTDTQTAWRSHKPTFLK